MSDFITRYERQFHDAARRELRGRLRTRLPRRLDRAIVVGIAVLAAVGVPAAAQNGWFPFAGRSDAPSTTQLSPDESLREMLSVLRRPQTEADRQAAGYALESFGGTFEGVQTAYIRRADVGHGDQAVILVPAESHQLTPASPVQRDVVCLWRTDYSSGTAAGGGRGCFESAQIANGEALQSLGHRIDMLVPDGVARVEATSADGAGTIITPSDNVASWQGSWPKTIIWYGDDGRVIRAVSAG